MRYFSLGFSIVVFIGAIIFSTKSHSANTLTLVDQYDDGGVTLCIYSDGRRSKVVEHEGAGSCPSKYISH